MKKRWIVTFLLVFSLLSFLQVEAKTRESGLLPFKKKSYLRLGKLDKLNRPTGARIHYKAWSDTPIRYKTDSKALDKLPGFHQERYAYAGSSFPETLYYTGGLLPQPWLEHTLKHPRHQGLITQFTYDTYGDKTPASIAFYENGLTTWLEDGKVKWVDYRISLLYQESELVPRQIKLEFIGLTKKGKTKPIKLGGKETFSKDGLATVILENTTPNAKIDYQTGKSTGQEWKPSNSSATDETMNTEVYVRIGDDSGAYYYDIPAEKDIEDYYTRIEQDAIQDGGYPVYE
ncbi:hypothetical protein ACVR1I_10340 [Streptococcus cameli]